MISPPLRVAARELTIEYRDQDHPLVARCFESARTALGLDASLAGYDVRRIDLGGTPMADVRATVRVNGTAFVGRGVAPDLAESASRAVAAALDDAQEGSR
jgi:hypothetical protein